MNANDRLALEIGRAVLRAVTAEVQLADALEKLASAKPQEQPNDQAS